MFLYELFSTEMGLLNFQHITASAPILSNDITIFFLILKLLPWDESFQEVILEPFQEIFLNRHARNL